MILVTLISCFVCCQAAQILELLAMTGYETLVKLDPSLHHSHLQLLTQYGLTSKDPSKHGPALISAAKAFERAAGVSQSALVPIHRLLVDSLEVRTFSFAVNIEYVPDVIALLSAIGRLARATNVKLNLGSGLVASTSTIGNRIKNSSAYYRALKHALNVCRHFLCINDPTAVSLLAFLDQYTFEWHSVGTLKAFHGAEESRKKALSSLPVTKTSIANMPATTWHTIFDHSLEPARYLAAVKQAVCRPVDIATLPFKLLSVCKWDPESLKSMIDTITELRTKVKACSDIGALFSLIRSYSYAPQGPAAFDAELDRYLRLQLLGESSLFAMNPARHAKFFLHHQQYAVLEDLLPVPFDNNLKWFLKTRAVQDTNSTWVRGANANLYCCSAIRALPPIISLYLDDINGEVEDRQVFFDLQYCCLQIELRLQRLVVDMFNAFDIGRVGGTSQQSNHAIKLAQYQERLGRLCRSLCTVKARNLAQVANTMVAKALDMYSVVAKYGLWTFIDSHDKADKKRQDAVLDIFDYVSRTNVYRILLRRAVRSDFHGAQECLDAVERAYQYHLRALAPFKSSKMVLFMHYLYDCIR